MSIGERSPKNKVKFMCSFGGKILPRPSDAVLKYVGGETRVVAISPDISFSELMKKLKAITENDNVLKYQIIPEDLDALVSVKSDEDVKHMIEEYNRHETPKLRTFLFPANSLMILPTPIKTRPSFTMSTSSSPKSESSPDGYTHEPPETGLQNSSYQLSRLYPMHKVHSSPNISQPYNHHHNAYLHYFNARQRPPAPLDFPRGTGWDPPQNSGGSNGRCGCNQEPRFWGRASSVPQSPRNHGLRF